MSKYNRKSILKYPGSKWKTADWIISHFPKHKVYVEPFFGSGAVFFTKSPVYLETINDIDGDVVNLFRVCRDYPDELARLIEFTPFSRQEYVNCLERSENPIEQARRTLVRYSQSFGTANSSRSSWSFHTVAGGPRIATIWSYLPNAIMQCCERLKDTQIECTDALELINTYNNKDTLIYLDPPYLSELRKKYLYKNEIGREKHEKLLNTIIKSSSKIVLSGYDNKLYNKMLSDWNTDTKPTTAQNGKQRVEKIWYNFDNQNYPYTLI